MQNSSLVCSIFQLVRFSNFGLFPLTLMAGNKFTVCSESLKPRFEATEVESSILVESICRERTEINGQCKLQIQIDLKLFILKVKLHLQEMEQSSVVQEFSRQATSTESDSETGDDFGDDRLKVWLPAPFIM